jgi:hypothetical protein
VVIFAALFNSAVCGIYTSAVAGPIALAYAMLYAGRRAFAGENGTGRVCTSLHSCRVNSANSAVWEAAVKIHAPAG